MTKYPDKAGWMEKRAAKTIEDTSPGWALSCKTLLAAGMSPKWIMNRLQKRSMDVGFLGLVEMALAHWKD